MPQPAAKITWLDKQFLKESYGGFWGYLCNFGILLGIVGVLACKNPVARKKAWTLLGWQLGILAIAIVTVIIFKRR